jgi:hypothetical protein
MMDEQKVTHEGYVTYRAKPRGGSISLPPRYAKGGKLPAGIYEAHLGEIRYQPLTIDEKRPAEIVFEPVTAPTFSGRVIDGITGEPIKGVRPDDEQRNASTSLVARAG